MTKPRDLTRLIDPESAPISKALLPKEPLIAEKKDSQLSGQGRGVKKKIIHSSIKKTLVTRRNIAFDEKSEEHLLRIKKHLLTQGFFEIDNQKTVEIALAVAFKNASFEDVQKLYAQILAKDSRRKQVTS